jgi:UDP-N-acetyl-D-mannosaminuronic acid transferase (WecB/TagA/CpsF family)
MADIWRRQEDAAKFTYILGVKFFHGTVTEAVEQTCRFGGLLVVPAAPALKDIDKDKAYREALLNCDLAIADSALMVMIWNRLTKGAKIPRVSGLEYLVYLLKRRDVGKPGNTVWIMPSQESCERNLAYLRTQHMEVPEECVVLAPMYGKEIDDQPLLDLLERLKPHHIVTCLGGGTQERLGLYIKRNLSYRPAIHCLGAAIAFLSGDQVHIPMWADRFYLGWLFRSLDDPMRFVPRYWAARKLVWMMLKHHERLPNMR